jgi:quercetin dioxygenase-like cupin family protein
MRRLCLGVLVVGALGINAALMAQQASPAAHHTTTDPATIEWKPGPPQLPAGVMVAALHGDPSKDGPFVVRLKLPAGSKVAPHWHPTDENLTVVQGTIQIGMGEKFDAAQLKSLKAGAYSFMPAKAPHFAVVKGETIIQVHGLGPFVLTYVNPADDPSLKKTSD